VETGSPGPAPSPAQGFEFVSVVRAQLPDIAHGRTDDEILAVARQACQDLSAGTPGDDVVAHAQTLGTLDAEATDQAGRVDEF